MHLWNIAPRQDYFTAIGVDDLPYTAGSAHG